MNASDSMFVDGLFDLLAHAALASGAFAAAAALGERDASTRLECALLGVLANAVALVLWNAFLGPDGAGARWRAAAALLLLLAAILRSVADLRLPPRRLVGGASALLGLFWIHGLLR